MECFMESGYDITATDHTNLPLVESTVNVSH